jgi:23S rRNA (pseudouridine1915-N3)-methyltransferase
MGFSMRITLAAVGRMKRSPLAAAFDGYAKRLTWPLSVKEVEEKRPLAAAQLMAAEGEALLAALPADAYVIALERGGKALDSEGFAALLQRLQDEGRREVAFVIGGADGLSREVLARADMKLTLGAMVWPHLLVRAMLAEQLYRAQSILAGHPYHRGS